MRSCSRASTRRFSRRSHSPYTRCARARCTTIRQRPSRSMASRYRASAAWPSLSSALDRARMPRAQSVPAARVRSSSCRRAAAAASWAPLRAPASTSSTRDQPKKHQIVVLACPLGAGECGLVASETVVQHGGHVLGQTDGPSLAPGGRVPGAGLDQLQRLDLLAAPGGEDQGGVPERRVAGRLRDRISLLDQR